MKRIALLTVLLLALGIASGFAADVIPPTIVATATLSWGVTLDKNVAGDMVNGFENKTSAILYVPLITQQTLTAKGEGAVYGQIEIANVELALVMSVIDAGGGLGPAVVFGGMAQRLNIDADPDKVSSVTAKIVASPLEIGVYAAPGMALDKVAAYAADAILLPAEQAVALIDAYTDIANKFGQYGTFVSYVSDAVTVTGKILSTNDWAFATKNDYVVGADAKLVFAPITLGAGVYYSLATVPVAPAPLAYVTLGVAMPMDTMKLTLDVAADLVLATTMDYDASVSTLFYLNSHKDTAGADVYDTHVGAGLVYASPLLVTTKDVEIHLEFAEPADNGFVNNLAFQLDAWIQNLMTAANMNTKIVGSSSYKVMLDATNYVTPGAGFTYGTHYVLAGYDASVLKANASVAISIIPKTVITATWTSGNLGVATSAAGTLGNFVIATVITY